MLRNADPEPGQTTRTPITRGQRLRHVLIAIIASALLLEVAAVQLVAVLAGRVDPDLVTTPAGAPAEALAVAALLALSATLAIALILGRRWLLDVDIALRSESAAPFLRRALGPLDLRASDGSVVERLPGSMGTLWVASVLGIASLGLIALAIPTIILADGRDPARTGWLALMFGGLLLAPAGTMAWWLVGEVERRRRTLTVLLDPESGSDRPTRERRWRPILIVILVAVAALPQAALGVLATDPTAGRVCFSSLLECRWVVVEAVHDEDGGRGQTVTVAYGVWHATGRQVGTLFMAPGGPGWGGIADWDAIGAGLDPRLTEAFDIVTFDPRGVAGSDHKDCAIAASEYYAALAVPDAPSPVERYVTDCLVEARVTVDELGRYSGDQIAGDIDAIRDDLGVERISLYGESYGTSTVQRYAARHPERVEALVLDGVIDLEQPTTAFWMEAADAFDDVLARTFSWCGRDVDCAEALPDPASAWDQVMARLGDGPVVARDGNPEGAVADITIGHADAIAVLGNALYDESGRMLALRALAAAARDDWVPLARMVGGATTVDSSGYTSEFSYVASWCADRVEAAPVLGPEEALAGIWDRAADRHVWDVELSGAACAGWPVPAGPVPDMDLAADTKVVILTSTGDPITPASMGRRVADRLALTHDVLRIEAVDGPHVLFGRGDPCIDDPVVATLLGTPVPDRTVRCSGTLVEPFVPVLRRTIDIDGLALRALGVEDELFYHPDYAAWSGVGSITIGCRHGGRITLTAMESMDTVEFEACAVLQGEPISGKGFYNDDGTFRLTGTFPRGSFQFSEVESGAITLRGEFDGATVQEYW